MLLLNKTDLFVEKLKTSPLRLTFPDYEGGDNELDGKQYMLQRFLSLDKKRDRRPLYSHFTCATDTAQVKVIMGQSDARERLQGAVADSCPSYRRNDGYGAHQPARRGRLAVSRSPRH